MKLALAIVGIGTVAGILYLYSKGSTRETYNALAAMPIRYPFDPLPGSYVPDIRETPAIAHRVTGAERYSKEAIASWVTTPVVTERTTIGPSLTRFAR